MTKSERTAAQFAITNERDRAYSQAFDLVEKLMGAGYKSKFDQVDDMIKIGKLAQEFKACQKAFNAMSKR